MYAKRYTNKKGEEKVEVLLSLEEAKGIVEVSPAELVAGIKRAIEDDRPAEFRPRGAPGQFEGLKMLFEGLEDASE
jgi:hypothetical protein